MTAPPGSRGRPVADSSRPGLGNPLLPARVFAPFFASAAPAFLIVAIGLGLSAVPIESTVLARAQSGTLALPDPPSEDITLYGVNAAGARPARAKCELMTSLRKSFVSPVYGTRGSERVVDGRTFYRQGEIDDGWRSGDTVTCREVVELLAVTDGRGRRLAMAGLFAAASAGSALMALIGYRSRRGVERRAAASGRPPGASS